MTSEIDEAVQAGLAETYRRGHADGVADAIKRLTQLAAEAPAAKRVIESLSLDVSIGELGLSGRVFKCLRREKIGTLRELYEYHDATSDGVADIRLFGRLAFDELNEKLTGRGLPALREVSFF